MEKETGSLNISVLVTCPHCKEYVDLFEDDHLIEEGWLFATLFEGAIYRLGCKDFNKDYLDSHGEDYECPKCNKKLIIGEIVY